MRFALILAACAVALAGCNRIDAAFDKKVHDYIVNHPEVLQEASDRLQQKEAQAQAASAKLAIAQNRQAIEHDPRDFVANPSGHVTVTEFYDYRCPHCADAAPAVLSLIKSDPDVRVVFKEFPIFGATSAHAAEAAIAVKQAGGDYLGLYRDYMNAHGLDDQAIDDLLKAHGVSPARLRDPQFAAQAEAQLMAVRKLALSIGVDGTPGFVIGDTLVAGEDMDAVRAAIAKAKAAQG